MKSKLAVYIIFFIIPVVGYSQSDVDQEAVHFEVKSLKDYFSQGQLSGHARNYFMATINEGNLSDYWSNAIGGSLKYETASWKGLQVGVKGIFTYQLFSSDLNKKDLLVNKGAKWEKELYDINRPHEGADLDRLEELFVKYSYDKSSISFGKLDLNKGPLFLRRDGRMKPFVYRGLWIEHRASDQHHFYGGYINGVSPRGMTEWYSINEAIGVLNNGFQYDGSKATYHEVAQSRGIGVFGYKFQSDDIGFQAWDYYIDRLYNTLWIEGSFNRKHLYAGVQYVYQQACNHQSNIELNQRYFQPEDRANVIALKVGYKTIGENIKLSTAYLHGYGTGRFLFPKELGRENFFVSQPRSWIDGFGLVNVYMIRGQLKFPESWSKGLHLDLRLSYTDAPSSDDYANNKYGKSDYAQVTMLNKYQFQKKLEGLEIIFLYIMKYSPDKDLSADETFYKTNLHHFNLIMNIEF